MNCLSRWFLACAGCVVCVCALAGEPREPGFNELVVIDPGVEQNGLPTPIVSNGQVEIPPTLHVHPYYYCGDKEYQAQIINGGPTIIVANHPRSGDKLYIDAVLPQGAPLVAYNARTITYIYPDRRVIIDFSLAGKSRAKVIYVNGRGAVREVHEQLAKNRAAIQDHQQKSRFVGEVKELGHDVGNVAKGTVGIVGRAGSVVVERTRALTRIIPGMQAIESVGDRSSERAALEEIRQAGLEQARNEPRTIPTLR
jgi:hypothetical protein